MTKHLRNSVFLASVAVIGASACGKKEEPRGAPAGSAEKKAPPPLASRVEVARLEGGTAMQTLLRPGEVEGAKEANLGSALGGYIEKVMVESGQRVTKGQTLARIDTSTHAAQLELAKVELDDAKRELDRVDKLGKAVAGARRDAAETRVARAQANYRLAQTRLTRATIKAPFDGVLVDLSIEQGEVAAPGQPIARLLVLDPITVSVSVTDRDVGLLHEGGVARVSTAGSPEVVEGTVSRIEPAADLRTRTFLVEVEVQNPTKALLPGMIANVEFQPAANGDVLLLPQDLLVTRLDSNGVFAVDDQDTVHWKPLQLGQIVGSQVEVAGGINRGERIVTVGMRTLSEGDKVIIAREGVCCRDGEVYFSSAQPSAKVPSAVEPPPESPPVSKPTTSAKGAEK